MCSVAWCCRGLARARIHVVAVASDKFRLTRRLFNAMKTSPCQASQQSQPDGRGPLLASATGHTTQDTNIHHTPAKPVGRLTSPVASGNKAMECEETEQVLQTVLMAYPGQASSLQGSHGADCDILAANALGIGSGWQQSKQNYTRLAVAGK